jgi:3-deoxy-D-manno-octulosonic-acid transferase
MGMGLGLGLEGPPGSPNAGAKVRTAPQLGSASGAVGSAYRNQAGGPGSQHSAVAEWVAVPSEVWLGDSLGEMALYYSLADVVLLGGSFAPLGGQNLIEAAACGCIVVMGPHTFNFSEVAERAVEAGAAVRVANMAEALEAVTTLLESDAPQRQSQAQDFAAAYGGAVARTVGALMALQPRLT